MLGAAREKSPKSQTQSGPRNAQEEGEFDEEEGEYDMQG
jgi:hypothetical protein